MIERDTDELSPTEWQAHKKEVVAAVREELMIWVKHECFVPTWRSKARNILDVRLVGKWKWVKKESNPKEKVHIIRMRMTQREFKDADAADLLTFAGTSSRVSQRIVVSEAAVQGWQLTAIDVKMAFLKGITYKQLAELTGDPVREVNFQVTAEVAAILRTIKGFDQFDHRTQVLSNLKPGTGTNDAPRCFAIKLTWATNDRFGAKATSHDPQLIVRHDKYNKLDFIATKHVEDIKVPCMPHVLAEFISMREGMFGKGELDITSGTSLVVASATRPLISAYEWTNSITSMLPSPLGRAT